MPEKTVLTEEAAGLLAICRECGGMEVHEESWETAQELIDAGLAYFSSLARGPQRAWKRLKLTDDTEYDWLVGTDDVDTEYD